MSTSGRRRQHAPLALHRFGFGLIRTVLITCSLVVWPFRDLPHSAGLSRRIALGFLQGSIACHADSYEVACFRAARSHGFGIELHPFAQKDSTRKQAGSPQVRGSLSGDARTLCW